MPVLDRCGTDPARTGPGDFLCVRETRGGWMTCDTGRMELLSWSVSYPPLSAVVPDARMECGPDVAPRSRAWKARTGTPFSREPTPIVQVRSVCDRPLLSVSDRKMPVLRARGGHGRRGPTALHRGGDGHKLHRRVRPVRDDHLPRWQGPRARASTWMRGFDGCARPAAQTSGERHGHDHGPGGDVRGGHGRPATFGSAIEPLGL